MVVLFSEDEVGHGGSCDEIIEDVDDVTFFRGGLAKVRAKNLRRLSDPSFSDFLVNFALLFESPNL
ncbi:hypothetical protein DIT71_16475 [Marinobacter vulgaris]|uniref:Uncharacterized protein n=1 Tax=Marinobacter vulgaris TaxID=1928331 RepID=A0A2V3ZFV6_9GAMM|nr:hypothetical protein DIT71_16475 [Marinobacter vulgaris]